MAWKNLPATVEISTPNCFADQVGRPFEGRTELKSLGGTILRNDQPEGEMYYQSAYPQ